MQHTREVSVRLSANAKKRARWARAASIVGGLAFTASSVIALLAGLGQIQIPRLVVDLPLAVLFAIAAFGTVRLGQWVAQMLLFRAGGPFPYRAGPVAAYPDRLSCVEGETVALHVHGDGRVEGQLVRLGATKEPVGTRRPIDRIVQSNLYDRRVGAAWQPTDAFDTAGLRPGFYALELTQEGAAHPGFAVPIIVKPRQRPRIAVVAATNTWEAYNAWGGFSNYRNDHMARWLFLARRQVRALPRPLWNTVPFRRPNQPVSDALLALTYPDADHGERLIATEWSLISFLEREGFPYGVYSDVDLAFAQDPLEADLLIVHGHTEYWAAEMVHAVERHVHAGRRLLVSGGNPLFSVVEFTNDGLMIDPTPAPRSGITRLIGSYYTDSGQHTAAPMKVTAPDHWVFAGLGVERDQVFGRSSCYRPHGGRARMLALEQDGASGVFTQETGVGAGEFQMLAVGLNPHGPAHVVFRSTPRGGWVFNSSSGAFTGALMRDDVLAGMMRNLIREALGENPAACPGGALPS